MKIVGVAGATEHGKDEIAKWFVRELGYVRYGFSEELKKEIRERLRRTVKAITIRDEVMMGAALNIPDHLRWHQDVDDDESWWDERLHWALWAVRSPTIRTLQQEYGMLRRHDDPEYWVNKWRVAVFDANLQLVVVPDVRMWTEAKFLRDRGAKLFKVVRPGHSAKGEKGIHQDPTERNLDDWTDYDSVFSNNGTIHDLHVQLSEWCMGFKL